MKDMDSFLRATKPTEGQAWVHVLCAVFSPEVTFSDVSHLRLAEGISTIPRARWATVCTSSPNNCGFILICYSDAHCVARPAVLSFNAAIVSANTIFRALGGTVTGSVSRSSL